MDALDYHHYVNAPQDTCKWRIEELNLGTITTR